MHRARTLDDPAGIEVERVGREDHRRAGACVGGLPDAAGGRAVLATPGDPSALAMALTGVFVGDLAGKGRSRAAWLEAGAERAARWSMADLAKQYNKLYAQAMVGSRA